MVVRGLRKGGHLLAQPTVREWEEEGRGCIGDSGRAAKLQGRRIDLHGISKDRRSRHREKDPSIKL